MGTGSIRLTNNEKKKKNIYKFVLNDVKAVTGHVRYQGSVESSNTRNTEERDRRGGQGTGIETTKKWRTVVGVWVHGSLLFIVTLSLYL